MDVRECCLNLNYTQGSDELAQLEAYHVRFKVSAYVRRRVLELPQHLHRVLHREGRRPVAAIAAGIIAVRVLLPVLLGRRVHQTGRQEEGNVLWVRGALLGHVDEVLQHVLDLAVQVACLVLGEELMPAVGGGVRYALFIASPSAGHTAR